MIRLAVLPRQAETVAMAIDVEELLALPEDERRALRDVLDQSLEDEDGFELTEEQWTSIQDSLAEYLRDPSAAIPAREAIMRLREQYAI